MRRRKLLTLLALLPLGALSLAATGSESSSSAEAVNVADQVVVSSTSATTSDGGSADATVLELGGETVVGGSQEGEGANSGAVISEGSDGGELTIGGWSATVTGEGSESQSSVVYGRSPDGDLEATVLGSRSEATPDGSRSSTTGADVNLGQGELHLRLLTASTSSDGDGSSAIAYVNDEGIFTSDQAGGGCEIPAEPLLSLLCLYAEQQEGDALGADAPGDAGVADVGLLDENVQAGLFQAAGSSSTSGDDPTAGGDDPSGDDPAPAPDAPEDDTVISAAPTGDDGSLPRTGGAWSLMLSGLASMGLGLSLRRYVRG